MIRSRQMLDVAPRERRQSLLTFLFIAVAVISVCPITGCGGTSGETRVVPQTTPDEDLESYDAELDAKPSGNAI